MAGIRSIDGVRAAVAAALVASLVACTGTGNEPESPIPEEPTAASTEEDQSEPGQDAVAGAGVQDFDPADVIVSQQVALTRNPEDGATIGVHSLEVDGPVMTLRLFVTPEFSSVSASDTVSLFNVWESNGPRPVLVDRANLKEYSPIREHIHEWTSDSVHTQAQNGSPMLAWMVYAAPEDDIESIDIRLNDSWPEFTDIPITR